MIEEPERGPEQGPEQPPGMPPLLKGLLIVFLGVPAVLALLALLVLGACFIAAA